MYIYVLVCAKLEYENDLHVLFASFGSFNVNHSIATTVRARRTTRYVYMIYNVHVCTCVNVCVCILHMRIQFRQLLDITEFLLARATRIRSHCYTLYSLRAPMIYRKTSCSQCRRLPLHIGAKGLGWWRAGVAVVHRPDS